MEDNLTAGAGRRKAGLGSDCPILAGALRGEKCWHLVSNTFGISERNSKLNQMDDGTLLLNKTTIFTTNIRHLTYREQKALANSQNRNFSIDTLTTDRPTRQLFQMKNSNGMLQCFLHRNKARNTEQRRWRKWKRKTLEILCSYVHLRISVCSDRKIRKWRLV